MPRDQIARFLLSGYVPQPKQCEFHAACRLADLPNGPEIVALGGDRGGAKSHAVMSQVSLDDCQRYPVLDVLYLRKVGKAARKALDQLRAKTFIHTDHKYNRNEGTIKFANGSMIVVGHFRTDSDIDQYVGIEYDIIVIEESTQISQHKKDLLYGSLRSSKPGWRARAYEAANPGGIGHTAFRKKFVLPYRAMRETDTQLIPISWRDNAFISPEYKKYLDGLTGVLRRMWRDGDWDVGAGQFFINWDHAKHVIRPFTIPAHWRMWISLDYGFTHPTSVHWHAESDQGVIYTVAEHFEARWLVEQHSDAIKATCERLKRPLSSIEAIVAGHDCFARRGDENARTIAEQYAGHGIHMIPADIDRVNGAAEMLRRLGNPEAGIHATWQIFDTCTELIEQIPAMLSNPRKSEDVLKVDADEEGRGGDDAYDDTRYGLQYVKMPVQQTRLEDYNEEVIISPY